MDDTLQTVGLDSLNAVPGFISCLHDLFLRLETEQSKKPGSPKAISENMICRREMFMYFYNIRVS